MPWDDDGMSFYYTHINKNKRERRNPIFSIAESILGHIFLYIFRKLLEWTDYLYDYD
jgi:hypothetical protein